MTEKKATGLTKGLAAIGSSALFALRVIKDAFRRLSNCLMCGWS